MTPKKQHLHITKVLCGWLPYIVVVGLAIFFPTLLSSKVLWVLITMGAAMVQRVIIDTVEWWYER